MLMPSLSHLYRIPSRMHGSVYSLMPKDMCQCCWLHSRWAGNPTVETDKNIKILVCSIHLRMREGIENTKYMSKK